MPMESDEVAEALAQVIRLGLQVQQALEDQRVSRRELRRLARAALALVSRLLEDAADGASHA